MFRCYLGSVTAASACLFSFRLRNRGDIVPSGVFGVCLLSYHHRFRSPPFVQATEPCRYSTYWVRSACTPLLPRPGPSVSIRSGWRIVVTLEFFAFVFCFEAHQRILVILSLRASLCSTPGSTFELYPGLWSPSSQGRRTMVVPGFSYLNRAFFHYYRRFQ